jgi:hypothetical protein
MVRSKGAQIGESSTVNGVTITLEDVGYSATETDVTLRISNQATPDSKNPRPAILDGASSKGGITERKPVMFDAQVLDANSLRQRVKLGAPDSSGSEITFSVANVLYPGASLSTVQGPWVFSFVPGALASDPQQRRVSVNQTVETSGVRVTVNSVQTSSSGVVVDYSLATDKTNFIGRENWAARMLLDDGTWIGGSATQDDPAQQTGDMQATFPPLRTGVNHFKLEFGPYAESLPGDQTMTIPLTSPVAAGQGSVGVDQAFVVDNEQVMVTSIDIRDGEFSINFQSVNQGPSFIGVDTNAPPTLTDNLGNEYRVSAANAYLPDSQSGSSQSGNLSLTYAGTIDPKATELQLRASRLVRIVSDSWDFDIPLPVTVSAQ